MNVHYDAGILLAADRNDRATWAAHRVRLELGVAPITTAPVIAQVSRSPRQVQLRRFLRGCDTVPFVPAAAHPVGNLLARAGTADVVDAHLIHTTRDGDIVITGDPDDLHHLADRAGRRIHIRRT